MASNVSRVALPLTATLLVGLSLLACSGSEEVNEIVKDDEEGPIPEAQQAEQALNEALTAFNDYCLYPRAQGPRASYPLQLFNPNTSTLRYRQLRALAEAGLLDTTITKGRQGLPVHRFALTKTGRASQYDIAEARSYRPKFCYAVPEVTRIDSIKAVYTSGPNPLARIWFTHSYPDVADWIDARLVRRSFSGRPPTPSPSDTLHTDELLIQVDSAWVDRRLIGYDRPPDRPSP